MEKEKESKEKSSAPWDNNSKPIYNRGSLDQIEKLIEDNLRLTEEIHKMTKKINNFVIWSRILGFLKILIIIAPIVLGIIYFRPMLDLFQGVLEPYKELLNLGGGELSVPGQKGSTFNLGNIDISQMSPELRKLIGQ